MEENLQNQNNPEITRETTEVKQKKWLKITLSLLVLGILLIGTFYAGMQFSAKKAPRNISPSETGKPSAYAQPSSIPQPTEEKISTPLVNKIIYAKEGEIIITDGTTKKSLVRSKDIISDIAISPDGQKVAYTFSSKDLPSKMFSFPITGLNIFNLKDETIHQLIPLKEQVVRYPFWSADSQYLTIWLNEGESSKIFNSTDGSSGLEIVSNDKAKAVSPIVFISSQKNKVAYIQNGELIEADINGQNKSVVLTNLKTTKDVHEGPSLPNPPNYSNDGNYVVVYFQNGDLAIIDKTNNKTKILAQGYKSEFFEGNSPSGYIIGFNKQNNFIYYIIGQGGYQYGAKPPAYIYFPKEDKTIDLPISSSTDLSSLTFSPDLEKVVTHSVYTGQGLNIYSSTDGKLINDCSKIDFRYSFYNWGGGPDYSLALKVWSTEGKYLVSQAGEKLKIINIENCSVSIVSDEEFNFASWMPI